MSGPSAMRSGAGWWQAQPDQVGYSIIDAKSIDLFMPSVFPPVKADTIEGLAASWALTRRCAARSTPSTPPASPGPFHPDRTGRAAHRRAEHAENQLGPAHRYPPFYGYQLRPGVTFTYLG
jgi:tricarballylate dehydrogenase